MPQSSPFGGASVVQKGKRKMQVLENQALAFCWVPGAGIEPARIAPLVFETSASTDSAIRAGCIWEGGPSVGCCSIKGRSRFVMLKVVDLPGFGVAKIL